MGAAFEVVRPQPQPQEERGDDLHVYRFAVVGGAGQRQFPLRHLELVDGAGAEHRQRLHRLHCRTRKHRPLDVTGGGHHPPLRIDDGKGAAMDVLHRRAAHALGKDGIGVHGKNPLARNEAPAATLKPIDRRSEGGTLV